jgi:hypothetical protein
MLAFGGFHRRPDSIRLQTSDSFQFDYAVTQTVVKQKKFRIARLHFYTKSGDHAGAEISRNDNSKGNLFIVPPGREQHHL